MFGRPFLTDPNRAREREAAIEALQSNERTITRAVRGVFKRAPCVDECARIACPTLVLHGQHDQAIALQRAKALVGLIANATLQIDDLGGHTLPLENPQFVATAIRTFIEQQQHEL